MGYVLRYTLPFLVERGRDTTISADVYTDAGVQQTPSAATLTLEDNGEVILDGVAASAGAPSTYTVTAATTSDRALSDRLLAIWTLTIGGTETVFQIPGVLARRQVHPTITDADLLEYHSDLDALRDADNIDTFEQYRTQAWEGIRRSLWRNGQRPYLVVDSWQLAEAHRLRSLELIFRDFAQSLGDGRYQELADYYHTAYVSEWAEVQFRYDDDEDGTAEASTSAARPVVYLSRPGDYYWSGRYSGGS